MVDLKDPRWKGMKGGYGIPYDPRPVLERLAAEGDNEEAWSELWNELHHQGALGEASYASIPVLAESKKAGARLGWNLYALVSCIEVERHRKSNPPIPRWLCGDYQAALAMLAEAALSELHTTHDPLVVRTAVGLVALAKGELELGAVISSYDQSEITELLDNHLAWSELYEPRRGEK